MSHLFDYGLLTVSVSICVFHKRVNSFLDKTNEKGNRQMYGTSDFLKDLLISLPLLTMIVRDMFYNSFSFETMGLPSSLNKHVDYILLMLGAYGMIQVLAQDTGIKTGVFQRNTVQQVILFAPIALGTGYGVTSNRSMALMAVLAYYHMKYAISNNVTSPVCFEEV
jgi:hypothetical protein